MITVKTFVHSLVDPKRILAKTGAILREIDPAYRAEEAAYTQALLVMREQLPEALEWIEFQEAAAAADILFMLWNGLLLNLECFHNPTCKQFLQLDYEDIHREGTMRSMPDSRRCRDKATAFLRSLTVQQNDLFEPVTAYFAYIETSAYKLAHYFGFLAGNELLPKVEPGYVPDHALSGTYGMELQRYLEVDIQKLIA